MDTVQKPRKRYHIRFIGGINLWKCEDLWYEHAGLGTSVMDSFWDCCRELEMATSDIHQ